MSDTPDTDAKSFIAFDTEGRKLVVVLATTSESFERERDEAREKIEDVRKVLRCTIHEGPILAALRVIEERDEAREFSNSRIQLTDNLYLQITGLLDDLEEYKKENAKLRDIAERAITAVALWAGSRTNSASKLRAELEQLKEAAK